MSDKPKGDKMSDSQDTGFGKVVPGFDFLQSLAKGASQSSPQMPNLANWIAPTLNMEDLEKRISELKTVHFWLEQNSKALGATVQALEVQKMTLATLKGMNFSIAEMANALQPKPVSAEVQQAAEKAAAAKTLAEDVAVAAALAEQARQASSAGASAPSAGLVDPMQLWGSLTQQFQKIAASALQDVGQNPALDATKTMAAEFAKEAAKTGKKATPSAADTAETADAAKKPAKKTTGRTG
jgi:hypothetical protein